MMTTRNMLVVILEMTKKSMQIWSECAIVVELWFVTIRQEEEKFESSIEEALGVNFSEMYEFISNDEEARSVRHGINSNKTWEFILNNSQILYDKSDDLSSSSISVNMEEKLFEGSEFTLCHYMGHLASEI